MTTIEEVDGRPVTGAGPPAGVAQPAIRQDEIEVFGELGPVLAGVLVLWCLIAIGVASAI